MAKKRAAGKGAGVKAQPSSTLRWAGLAVVGLTCVIALQWFLSSSAPLATPLPQEAAGGVRSATAKRSSATRAAADMMAAVTSQMGAPAKHSSAEKHSSLEWQALPRDLEACLAAQDELMRMPVDWPGFHALCLESVDEQTLSVRLHSRSGKRGESGTYSLRVDAAPSLTEGLITALQERLMKYEFQPADLISTSEYEFPPNPWKLFTAVGGPVETDDDLRFLGGGAAVYLYVGGQFIWPGVRIGHEISVPVPVAGGHKHVTLTTVSLRPMALVLSGFLTPDECDFIKQYAANRMVPSGLAMMDSTAGNQDDVRTSTQTFMERNGSPQIRALEERAHNLTRLPYELGENIQVVRYKVGQKYGAHRDFFNPNDYHRQPQMLRSVEYGGRNRMATVFWYLQTVEEGGETFFPRALNEQGREYNPWNGNHEDCYRGLSVKPVQGNAVLFYSIVPDGRLDERSLHGGCKPRGDTAEKWGANQWIWNHPHRHSGPFPRRTRKLKHSSKPGCEDSEENCGAWAAAGECEKNPSFMHTGCRASCGVC